MNEQATSNKQTESGSAVGGSASNEELAGMIKPEHIARFRKLARGMDKLMREICEYNQKAELYIEDSWNANLMRGPAHSESRGNKALHENVAAHEIIYRASGGAW